MLEDLERDACIRTYYAQVKSLTNLRFRRDLTLIDPAVSHLRRTDLQGPLVAAIAVQRLKTLIVCVR